MHTLTVNHNIFLTRDQRYKVARGEQVEVTGVCVPVWFTKDFSTEPAVEVFCRYHVMPDQPLSVRQGPGGFLIGLPTPPTKPPPIPESVWRSISQADKDA